MLLLSLYLTLSWMNCNFLSCLPKAEFLYKYFGTRLCILFHSLFTLSNEILHLFRFSLFQLNFYSRLFPQFSSILISCKTFSWKFLSLKNLFYCCNKHLLKQVWYWILNTLFNYSNDIFLCNKSIENKM